MDPRVAGSRDLGRLGGGAEIRGVTLYFKPSGAQQAALDALLKAQRTPGAPEYHAWLTPEQYAARFGVNDSDIGKAAAWLRAQGLGVSGISRARNRIAMDGTAAALEQAFGTEIHRYQRAGQEHFANARPLRLPAELQDMVLAVRNLNDFRPQPRVLRRKARPDFTSSITGNHYLAPGDVATIYNITPLYTAGDDGSGHTLAVVEQTAMESGDLAAFRSASGLPATTPSLVLVPNSGTSTVSTGDIEEASLDVEWAGAIAPAATEVYVYTGNNTNYNVLDSLQYAIDNKLAPVISISYGICEVGANTEARTLQSWAQQANSQGQTIVASAGDTGAADCDAQTESVATLGLAVDLPGSVPEVTSVGGTEFLGDVNDPAAYWASTNSANNASALAYIPEEVWNDTAVDGTLAAGGGGASIIFTKPTWQTGLGVPADGARDVPDISLDASADHDGYLYCSQGSCVNGFRQSNNDLTVAGGTSFGAPIFAGMLTVLEQATGSTGEGNINPTLYAQAATASTYAAAFHDITSGNNIVPCTVGSTGCAATCPNLGYQATAGYDEASGLGSLNLDALVEALNKTLPNPTLGLVQTTVTAPAQALIVGTAGTFTATLAPAGTGPAPTGTVQFTLDGADYGGAVALSGTQATASVSFSTSCGHTVGASYSGDGSYSPSFGSTSVAVNGVATTLNLSTSSSSAPPDTVVTAVASLTAGTGNALPSGSVQFAVDGGNSGSAVTLSNGQASTSISFSGNGTHTIAADYSGSTTDAPSSNSAQVQVGAAVSPPSGGGGGGGGGGAAAPALLAALAALGMVRFRRRIDGKHLQNPRRPGA